MTIIRADYVMRMNEAFEVIHDGAVAFEESIKAVGPVKVVRDSYPDADYINAGVGSVLLPGLVNPHVHLEFSANRTTLACGDFIGWLKSVIAHRDELNRRCGAVCMKKVLDAMIETGTTTIGAVSSFGFDLKPCVHSPMNVVYFNEVLGSSPAMVDALYASFYDRLSESESYAKKDFIPAISVHSPYSTHPILAKKAIAIAREKEMVVSTHFMESRAEREWLDSGSGPFAAFFEEFMPGSKPVNEPLAYIDLFEGVATLFTHAVHATNEEFARMEKIGMLTHCPISNRLLQNGRLPIEKLHSDRLTLGTDGYSSNYTLNLWEEMRAALMMHTGQPLHTLAATLLKAATRNAAAALGTNGGELSVFKDADFIVVKLPDRIEREEDLPLHIILHTTKPQSVYIAGKER